MKKIPWLRIFRKCKTANKYAQSIDTHDVKLTKLLRLAYELGREDERTDPSSECSRDFLADVAKLKERWSCPQF